MASTLRNDQVARLDSEPPASGRAALTRARRLQLKASSLSWPHSPQRSIRKAVGQDAALEEDVELIRPTAATNDCVARGDFRNSV
jgi:hypothetical protein